MMPGDLLLGLAALGLLVFPGWLLSRTRGLPLPLLAGFVFGAVCLVLLIQLLDAIGLGLSAGTVIPGWLIISLGALLASRRPALAPVSPISSDLPWRTDWPLILPVIPAIAVVACRAIAQPLFGIDTVFRWNFLAEQMLARGTLGFYPPVSAADYAIYAWPDGIAPVVSSLYFLGYTLAGASRPVLTAPFVIFQFLLLLAAVYALTRQLASPRAAAIACALVACSPIIMWSAAMGQESGLIALALLALLLYLPASREAENAPATIIAGLATALGGLAREYGLAFVLFGLALGVARQLSARTVGLFLLAATLGLLPWYGRNWLHTGNPLFNLDVTGLFPVNAAHHRLMQIYQESFGWGRLPPEAFRIFATNCLAAVVGGTTGACLCFKKARPLVAALLVVAGLWAVSLGFTAAGFTSSLRVLSPALLIAAILGGAALARWVPARRYLAGLVLALLIFASDAALRTLVLPANVYKIPPSVWLAVGGAVHEYHQRPVYRQLADYTAGRRILVLGPAALLNQNGASTVPLWSPEVGYLWDESVARGEAVRRLTDSGIGFVLINTGEVNREYLDQIAFFRRTPNPSLQPIWSDSDMTLFKVAAPVPSDGRNDQTGAVLP